MTENSTQAVLELLKGTVRTNPIFAPSGSPGPKEITRTYLNRAQMMSLAGDKNYKIINLWQKDFEERKPIKLVTDIEELNQLRDRILWYNK